MNRIVINATNGIGNKIQNALKLGITNEVYYSLKDMKKKSHHRLRELSDELGLDLWEEFPLYYLLQESQYDENIKELHEYLDIQAFDIPINKIEYSAKYDKFSNMIKNYYENYCFENVAHIPTLFLNDTDSWIFDRVFRDLLEIAKASFHSEQDNHFVISVIFTEDFINNSKNLDEFLDVVQSFDFENVTIAFAIERENNKTRDMYDLETYNSVFNLLRRFKESDFETVITFSGIRDLLYSIIGNDQFSVGWYKTYQHFECSRKKLDLKMDDEFGGRRTKKLYFDSIMSEIRFESFEDLPEDLILKLADVENIDDYKIDLLGQNFGFNSCELIFWCEYKKTVSCFEFDSNNDIMGMIRNNYYILEKKIDSAIFLLSDIIDYLKSQYLNHKYLEENIEILKQYKSIAYSYCYEELILDF